MMSLNWRGVTESLSSRAHLLRCHHARAEPPALQEEVPGREEPLHQRHTPGPPSRCRPHGSSYFHFFFTNFFQTSIIQITKSTIHLNIIY